MIGTRTFNVTPRVRGRFVKDCNLPIKLLDEPYFSQRLALCALEVENPEKLWDDFLFEYGQLGGDEERYFAYYNSVKDAAINSIKETPAYQEFISCDFKRYQVNNQGIGENSVFKSTNVGKTLMSIDLAKGNFTALRHFSSQMVGYCPSYEDFMYQFTSCHHLVKSKYIRQVIFGNCNPKRQVGIEKFLMQGVLDAGIAVFGKDRMEAYMSDEVVIDVTDATDVQLMEFNRVLDCIEADKYINLHRKTYLLKKIPNTDWYVQYFTDGTKKFKSLPALFYPFVAKAYLGQELTEDDKVFFHEGYQAKFLNVPEIEVV